MSSEQVSMQELDHYLDACVKGHMPDCVGDGVFRALRHYKDIREKFASTFVAMMDEAKDEHDAQQAEPPAGCAEMAREIATLTNQLAREADSWESLASRTQAVVENEIEPLFTLLADCEPHLREVDNEYTRQFDDAVENSREEAELAVKLVAIDELLCKIAALTENTERIDAALGKGDAEGGREEGK